MNSCSSSEGWWWDWPSSPDTSYQTNSFEEFLCSHICIRKRILISNRFCFAFSPRPFVEFVSAPFWSVVSTRFRQAKNILMMAIFSWIVFTVAIGLIKPPPHSCWREMNATHQAIERLGYSTSSPPANDRVLVKRQTVKVSGSLLLNKTKESLNRKSSMKTSSAPSTSRRRKTTLPPKLEEEEDDSVESNEEDNPITENNRLGAKSNFKQSPDSIHLLPINKSHKTMGNPMSITHTNLSLVKPLASQILYEKKDVRNVFMVFLLLIIIGEFFSAPAITLAVSGDRRQASLANHSDLRKNFTTPSTSGDSFPDGKHSFWIALTDTHSCADKRMTDFAFSEVNYRDRDLTTRGCCSQKHTNGDLFRLGCLHIIVSRTRHGIIWSTTDVRQSRLGFGDLHRCNDSR